MKSTEYLKGLRGKRFRFFGLPLKMDGATGRRIRTNVACTSTTLSGGVCATGSSTFAVTSNGTANFTTELENYAAFGQANLNFTPRLRGVAGLRWSHDQISFDFARVSAFPTATAGVRPSFTAQGTNSTDGVSGRIGLQYDVADNVLGYVNYSRGYKGPAINVFFNMQAFDTLPLDPEKSDAYEAGLKSTLLDRKLVLNLAAFSTKFKGFQTTRQASCTHVIFKFCMPDSRLTCCRRRGA